MPVSYNDLTIRGRDGNSIPVTDCRIEPLNLLIPGVAPIVVPRRRAWRAPRGESGQGKHGSRTIIASEGPMGSAYDADDDDDDEDDTKPLVVKRKKTPSKLKKDRSRERRHRQRAEEWETRAARERAEKVALLERQKQKQESYIAKLRTRYQKRAKEETSVASSSAEDKSSKQKSSSTSSKSKRSAKKYDLSSTDDESTDCGDATDGSAKVREMLQNIKIRAAGTDSGHSNNKEWTISEDSQLMAMKNGGQTWKEIGDAMGRYKGELQRHYKTLQKEGFKIPGADDDTTDTGAAVVDGGFSSDVATAGVDTTTEGETTDAEATTDAERTGQEITDAEKTDGDTDDEEAKETDRLAASLFGALDSLADEKTAETEAPKEEAPSPPKPTSPEKPPSSAPPKPAPTAAPFPPAVPFQIAHEQPAATIESDCDNAGVRTYLGQYAQQLLADQDARIPTPDGWFDEDDCMLMALADRHRSERRWLDIQADFANVTGRLVPVEVLMWKLEGGVRPSRYD